MLYIQFGGGLGNQMFQYAYLYSQFRNSKLIDKSLLCFMHRNTNEDRRDFALANLNISLNLGKILDENELPNNIKWYILRKKFFRKVINNLPLNNEKKIQILVKNGICSISDMYYYSASLRIVKEATYVEGAFQTWKYFQNYKSEIKKEFKISIKPSKENIRMLFEIQNCNAVCVHIRRGDFINSFYAKELNVCAYDYYKAAIDYICKKIKNPVFFIFSNSHDDHLWIQKNYKFEQKIIHVDLDNPDYEELRLMESCKHFIISNSTFSWWAQYLSENNSKIVVAPSKWNNNEVIDTDGIYMPDWKII